MRSTSAFPMSVAVCLCLGFVLFWPCCSSGVTPWLGGASQSSLQLTVVDAPSKTHVDDPVPILVRVSVKGGKGKKVQVTLKRGTFLDCD